MEKANWTFEEQWSQSLGGAEVSPPAQVWVAIDGRLANQQAMGYKKQADFYRWIAAACLFLVTLGGAFYFIGNDSSVQFDLANDIESSNPIPDKKNGNRNTPLVTLGDDEETEDLSNATQATSEHSIMTVSAKEVDSPPLTKVSANVKPEQRVRLVKSVYRYQKSNTQFVALSSKSTSLATNMAPWEAEHLYGVARTWEVVEPDEIMSPLWAGVSFSTGSFDPGFGSSSKDEALFASADAFSVESASVQNRSVSPVYASGQSVAGGLNLGKKFTKRIILSSGLHYSAFNTGPATSQIVSDTDNNTFALTNEASDSNLENAISKGNLRYAGEQVQLANEYQYLTIPIKAGYVLLDKKFNITFNTGLSSNILVDSKLVSSGESEELNNDFSTSQSYESVYFNFLTSVEFGYVFKQHYQFLLEPNYNQALTDFTNANHADRGKPKNIGIAIGFRYNF